MLRITAISARYDFGDGHELPGQPLRGRATEEGAPLRHGTAITIAAAAALQELGSSSALVYTPSSNVGAVATYKSAGFQPLPEIRDQYRDAKAENFRP